MTSKTLGNLTDATALTGTEQVYVVQSSNSRKSTAQAIADLGTSQDNMSDGTTNKNYTATEQTKLAGIATGATANTGTVTSAALSVPTGLSVSGSPITTSGTFAITYASGYEGFTTALKTLVNSAVQPTDVREVLTANRTYYVATTGSDSNDGLTSGTAFLTIQKAVDTTAKLDISIYNVTINVGAGTYTAGASAYGAWVGSGVVSIVGDNSTPSNVIISVTGGNSVLCRSGAALTVSGFKLTTATSGYALYATGGGSIVFSNIEFGAVGNEHIFAENGGTIFGAGNYTISGGGTRHMRSSGGWVQIQSRTVTLTGSPAFSSAFAVAQYTGFMLVNGNTYSGTATGKRYDANLNGVIQSAGGGASYFPGDTAGTTATGGQYA